MCSYQGFPFTPQNRPSTLHTAILAKHTPSLKKDSVQKVCYLAKTLYSSQYKIICPFRKLGICISLPSYDNFASHLLRNVEKQCSGRILLTTWLGWTSLPDNQFTKHLPAIHDKLPLEKWLSVITSVRRGVQSLANESLLWSQRRF